jgi:hypothetical protein
MVNKVPQISNEPTHITSVIEDDNISNDTMKALHEIVNERYKMSFDRSRLTPASEIHQEAKRLLGIDIDYA